MTYSRGAALPIQHLHLTLRLDMRHLQIACSSGLVFGSRAAIIASDRQARTRRHLWKRDAMKWWSCCASKWEGGQWWNDAWRKNEGDGVAIWDLTLLVECRRCLRVHIGSYPKHHEGLRFHNPSHRWWCDDRGCRSVMAKLLMDWWVMFAWFATGFDVCLT
jgi:hypothetical protein